REIDRLSQRGLILDETTARADAHEAQASLDRLARLYEARGRYDRAESFYRSVIQLGEAAYGKDHPALAIWLLGPAGLHQRTGRYASAESLYRRCLRMWTATFGEEHPYVANCLTYLAELHTSQQRWEEAALAHDRARRILRRHVRLVLPAL